VVPLVLGLLLAAGCQPAGHYGKGPLGPARQAKADTSSSAKEAEPKPPAGDATQPPPPEPLPPGHSWMEPTLSRMEPEVPLVFVAADTPDEWSKLTQFWTPAAEAGAGRFVQIKVPLGLDHPTFFVPPANPPTAGKWALGKQLFFDEQLLKPGAALACATCHRPDEGFSERYAKARPLGDKNTASLINCAYNRHQFWDGRATALEEVVQRQVADEREVPGAGPPERSHVWGGVVKRLRARPDYVRRFQQVFGTLPTQDAVGKALATYLRTVLSGGSLYDKASQAMGVREAKTLAAADFEKVLDPPALVALGRESAKPAEVARELHLGYRLFFDPKRVHCVRCHSGATFSDKGFHNLGVGDSSQTLRPGEEPGRFASLPPGLKDRHLIGAYQTPALRALPRTAPYMHDGSLDTLDEVVEFYNRGGIMNPYLAPELLADGQPRKLDLGPDELRALVLFLKALDGEPVDAWVADPKKWPEGTTPPKQE
jgi:cytochrome c peroxidase